MENTICIRHGGVLNRLWIAIDPIGKPRQTQSDKWKQRPCVMAYRAFADDLRAACVKHEFTLPMEGLRVDFRVAMPRSWSKKKRATMNGQPHQQKPDLDNMTKAVMDALLGEDCRLWSLDRQEKRWSDTGSITFSLSAPEAL